MKKVKKEEEFTKGVNGIRFRPKMSHKELVNNLEKESKKKIEEEENKKRESDKQKKE